ncbi:MAG: EI24 domain-containing protein [Hydrococcus sp. Prado102]|jgi:CysZ protein|nr:EI24 domain-containing protein [Hydrococcus sp. Prado102]
MRQVLSGFGFFSGASYPFRALAVVRRTPRLWGYLLVPILLNFILGITFYAGSLYFGWQAIQDLIVSLTNWIDTLIANLPAWLGILEYLIVGLGFLLRFLLVIILFLVTGFVFAQVGVTLGAPWYGKLSEQLEKLRTGQLQVVEVGIVKDIGRAILFELKKLALIICIGIPLFLLNFVAGIGTLFSTTGGIILTGTIVCLDFFDGPLERRRLSFREKLGIVYKSLPASAGFGLVCLGLISIPLLNLVTIPLCVASGTLFCCDRILPKYFLSSLEMKN